MSFVAQLRILFVNNALPGLVLTHPLSFALVINTGTVQLASLVCHFGYGSPC